MKSRITVTFFPIVNPVTVINPILTDSRLLTAEPYASTPLQASDNTPCPHPATSTKIESATDDSSGIALNPVP
jgi:hypothetical protein